MLIRCGYQISLVCAEPTPLITMLAVRDDQPDVEILRDHWHSLPAVPVSLYRDLAGNRCQRLVAPAGALLLEGDTIIRCSGLPDQLVPQAVEVPVSDLPAACLLYLLGSRYCETDRLSQFAWDQFGAVPPGWGRVQAICDFVHGHVRFAYDQASATRTAHDTLDQGVGVCRDFAHLAIALCRCLNIPARYVNGHLGDIGVPVVEPMDFSAWMEVYLGGGWHVFDPRNNRRRIGRIVIARGRDAADVPLLNSFGPHLLEGFSVWTHEVASLAATPPPAPPAPAPLWSWRA
ncbi:transglutaminase-like domain-containing protein [Sandarakinorhabdus oryzae]|uniref:transglutaminase-like domain-containing protein n=1 Tax=Sandarakinorhabdus oryzae TaxID=2675220 RepID=UPI0012E14D15|nr:transglutaminase family protein [Sandarakinorhabdus oryzae]